MTDSSKNIHLVNVEDGMMNVYLPVTLNMTMQLFTGCTAVRGDPVY